MSSVHVRGYTLLIIITLFFAAFSVGHHKPKQYRLVNQTVTTQKVACQRHRSCPAVQVEVRRVYLP